VTGSNNADGAGDVANASDVSVAATGITLAGGISVGFVIVVAAVIAAVSETRVLQDATDVRGNGLCRGQSLRHHAFKESQAQVLPKPPLS